MAFNKIDMSVNNTESTSTFAGEQNVIIGALVANTHTAAITVDMKLRGKYVIKGVEIPVGSSLSVLDGKLIALQGDTLDVRVVAPVGGTADVIFSTVEEVF
jgi:hypothetical protein